jgi:hypothetical protein
MPSTVTVPFFIKPLFDAPLVPYQVVGTGLSANGGYDAKEDIELGIRYEGLAVWSTDDDKLYRLIGGITDLDWQDVTGSNTFWQKPVLSLDNDPPGGPVLGDRYLVDTAPTGAWTGFPDHIAEWDGAEWDFLSPVVGMVTFIRDVSIAYLYVNSNEWVEGFSLADHNGLDGLQGGNGTTEFFHLDQNQYDNIALRNVDNDFLTDQTINGDLFVVNAGALSKIDIANGTESFLQTNASTEWTLFGTDLFEAYIYSNAQPIKLYTHGAVRATIDSTLFTVDTPARINGLLTVDGGAVSPIVDLVSSTASAGIRYSTSAGSGTFSYNGTSGRFTTISDLHTSGDLIINTLGKVILDGNTGNHTYLHEISADAMGLVTGGALRLTLQGNSSVFTTRVAGLDAIANDEFVTFLQATNLVQALNLQQVTDTGNTTTNPIVISGTDEIMLSVSSSNAFPSIHVTGTSGTAHPLLSFRDVSTQKAVIGLDIANDLLTFGRTSVNNDYMVIDSLGQVGIGTSTPATSLDVEGDQISSAIIKITNTNALGYSAIDFHNEGGTLSGGIGFSNSGVTNPNQVYIYTATNAFNIRGASGSNFFIKTTGEVGIGTTNPETILEINNPLNPSIRVTDTRNTVRTHVSSQETRGFIGTFSNHDLRLMTNNASRMTIKTDGNVGIGTTAPTETLQVEGTTLLNGVTTISTLLAANLPLLTLENTSATGGTRDSAILFKNSAQDWLVGLDDSNIDAFTIASSTSFATEVRLTILSNTGEATFSGDVNTQNLDVDGTGTFSGIVTADTDIYLGAYIYHKDNTSTYIRMLPDQMIFGNSGSQSIQLAGLYARLNYNSAEKLRTVSDGIDITGNLAVTGTGTFSDKVGIGTTNVTSSAQLLVDRGTTTVIAMNIQHSGSGDGDHDVLGYLDQGGASTWTIKSLNLSDFGASADFAISQRGQTNAFIVRNNGNVEITGGNLDVTGGIDITQASTSTAGLFLNTARYGIYVEGDGVGSTQYLLSLKANGGLNNVLQVGSDGNSAFGGNIDVTGTTLLEGDVTIPIDTASLLFVSDGIGRNAIRFFDVLTEEWQVNLNADNALEFETRNGVRDFQITNANLDVIGTGAFSDDVLLSPTKKLVFDNGSGNHSYIWEGANSIIRVVTGGTQAGEFKASNFTVPDAITAGGIITAVVGNSTEWSSAYDKNIVNAEFNNANGVLTLTKRDTNTETTNLDGRYNRWRGDWVSGTQYEPFDEVLDESWLAIANTTTSEKAAPQPIGPSSDSIELDTVFVQDSDISVVTVVHEYTFTEGGWYEGIQIKVPFYDLNVVSKVTVINVTEGTATIINNPVLSSDNWVTLDASNVIIPSGAVYRIELDYFNSAAANRITGGWNSDLNGGVAGSQLFTYDDVSNPTFIEISHTDLDSGNRSTELDGVVVGSIIIVTETGDVSRTMELEVTAVDLVPASSTRYTVTVIGGNSTVRDSRTCTINVDVPVTTPSEFYKAATYYPTGNPSWATLTTALEFDGVDQAAPAGDAYGINVHFQPGTISTDWDVKAFSDGLGAAGGEGGANSLNELFDVTLGAVIPVADRNTLVYDGNTSQWVNNDQVAFKDLVNTFTASQIVKSAAFPVVSVHRTTALTGGSFNGTSGIASGTNFITETSGDMTDGFGGGMLFSIGDDTVTATGGTIARIYARRDGADNQGLLQFWVGSSGLTIAATIRQSGNFLIGKTTDSGEKLQVVGTALITEGVTTDVSNSWLIRTSVNNSGLRYTPTGLVLQSLGTDNIRMEGTTAYTRTISADGTISATGTITHKPLGNQAGVVSIGNDSFNGRIEYKNNGGSITLETGAAAGFKMWESTATNYWQIKTNTGSGKLDFLNDGVVKAVWSSGGLELTDNLISDGYIRSTAPEGWEIGNTSGQNRIRWNSNDYFQLYNSLDAYVRMKGADGISPEDFATVGQIESGTLTTPYMRLDQNNKITDATWYTDGLDDNTGAIAFSSGSVGNAANGAYLRMNAVAEATNAGYFIIGAGTGGIIDMIGDVEMDSTLNVVANATLNGDVEISSYIKHIGNLGTFIRFLTDEIRLGTGTVDRLTITNSVATIWTNLDVQGNIDITGRYEMDDKIIISNVADSNTIIINENNQWSGGTAIYNKAKITGVLTVESGQQLQIEGKYASASTSRTNGGTVFRITNTDPTDGNMGSLIFQNSNTQSIGGIYGYNVEHINNEGEIAIHTRSDVGTFAERFTVNHARALFSADIHLLPTNKIIFDSGSGNGTYIYEQFSGALGFVVDNTYVGKILSDGRLLGNGAGKPSIDLQATTSSVTAVFRPDQDNNTGLGGATGELDLIIGGSSALNANSTNITIKHATNPVVQLRNERQASDWIVGDPIGQIDFYSEDTSGGGAGVKARIEAYAGSTTGGGVGLKLRTGVGATTVALQIDATGIATFNNTVAGLDAVNADDFITKGQAETSGGLANVVYIDNTQTITGVKTWTNQQYFENNLHIGPNATPYGIITSNASAFFVHAQVGQSLYLGSNGVNDQLIIQTDGRAFFKGELYVPDRIRHTDDVDTYIYFQTDNIEIWAGGNKNFEIDVNSAYLKYQAVTKLVTKTQGIEITGTCSGSDAVNSDDFITLGQAESGTITDPNAVLISTTQTITGLKTFSADVTISSARSLIFSANNSRILWGTFRAMEGDTTGTNLTIGETFTNTRIYSTTLEVQGVANFDSSLNVAEYIYHKDNIGGGAYIRFRDDRINIYANGLLNVDVTATSVNLRYAGSIKLATQTDGVDVTGKLDVVGSNTV